MIFIEFFFVIGLIGWQTVVFLGNLRLIKQIAAMYPAPEELQIEVTADVTDGARHTTYDALVLPAETSEKFAEVVTDTNEYLANNKGAAADFNILKDISERHAEELDDEIQAQIATPLYLGLLGTFLGAMLGLYSLLGDTGGAAATAAGGAPTSFLRDEQIIAFLWGVGIAMAGSFAGLAFTLSGNHKLKTARTRRDKLKNAYYTFLQKRLLPKLNSDMQRSMGDLKSVLDAFNKDFFSRIQDDFFAKFAQILPLMDRMGENITKTSENIIVQRDFLDKLQTIGYTQLANATIKVFDRVDQSAATFEKFMGYQEALNHTVLMGTEATRVMAALLGRLNSLEQAAQQLPDFIHAHDQSLRDMVVFFQEQQGTLANVRAGLEQRLDQSARSLQEIVDRRINEMEAERQLADDKLRNYFASLNDQNVYDKVVRYLQPFGDLPLEQKRLTTEQNDQNKRAAKAMEMLDARLRADEQIQRDLQAEVARLIAVQANLARVQEEMARRGVFGRLFGSTKSAAGPNGR